MNRRGFLRVAGVSVVGTTVITTDETISTVTAADSAPGEHGPGPDRTSSNSGPTFEDSPENFPEGSPIGGAVKNTTGDQEQVVLSGQLTGNYSTDVGRIRIGLPSENKSTEILSDGSFAVDVPRDTFIDVAYVEENGDGLIIFNGNPDVYYIETLEQVSEDRDLGTTEIPEPNVFDLQFEGGSGEPLDGITVAVRSLNTETDRWWQISVSTGTDGFYQSSNSPTGIEVAGDVQVAVLEDTDDSRVSDLDVVVDERLNVTEPRFESYTVDPITVNGDLVRPNGAPVAGGTISVFVNSNDSADVVTDQEGSFEIQLPQSADFVDLAYEIQYYRAGIINQNETIAEGSWVEMYAGPELEGTIDQDVGTIQLPEGDLVTGRVVDETGSPVEGATIQYVHRNQAENSAAGLIYPTDETGVIDLNGRSGVRLSGTVTLGASPPDSDRFVDTTVEETITVDGTTTVELELSEKSTVDSYRNDQGVVDTNGLLDAAADFRNGDIDTSTLLDVAAAFRSGNPVT